MVAATGAALSFPLLSMLVFIPAVGALAVTLMPRRRPEYAKLTAAVASVATGALTVWATQAFDTADDGFQFVSRHPWIEAWGISWHLGVDGISLFLVLLTGLLFPLAILGIDPHNDDPARDKPYFAWLLLLEAGVMGSFISLDLFLFFVFFEIVLVPMYFLIGGWGYEGRVYAATKFFLYTMIGSAFMLVSILATVFIARNNGLGYVTFDLVELANEAEFAASTGRWLFFGFAVAFAVKVPVFPLHTWLPDAHTQAPTAGSVVLAGVMLKLGTYGMLRFGLYLFPEAAYWSRYLWLTLATIGIIYGAIAATMQKDLKRLVAYSSVAHLGFIVLGTFAFTTQAITGSVIQMVNHGVSTGALFLMVGMIYERRHTRQIAELNGIQKVAPIFAAAFMVVMLSSIGVPGLNGFVGEFLVLIGSFATARWWVVIAATGVILAALYLLWAYQRVFHGEPDEENATFRELRWGEAMVILPFIAAIFFAGLYPKPMLDRIEPAVDALVERVAEHTDFEIPTPTIAGEDD
ncbi:MAG: NADH-quinone oxidoreductase subunit M [Ilumatobacteraceae bacterium]|jgi:NADH-quinone oxidoreductase subunit M|nr:NADH-quinone oxidoreductase subunit M [Ilumatobacteraceae bacterium]